MLMHPMQSCLGGPVEGNVPLGDILVWILWTYAVLLILYFVLRFIVFLAKTVWADYQDKSTRR